MIFWESRFFHSHQTLGKVKSPERKALKSKHDYELCVLTLLVRPRISKTISKIQSETCLIPDSGNKLRLVSSRRTANFPQSLRHLLLQSLKSHSPLSKEWQVHCSSLAARRYGCFSETVSSLNVTFCCIRVIDIHKSQFLLRTKMIKLIPSFKLQKNCCI